MEDTVIVFIVFSAIALVITASLYFNYRKRRVVYDAIQVAIEKTGSVEPALVEAIMRENVGPNADLRKGIILIAIAAAFGILGFLIPEQEALGPMLGVAAFPGFVGFAYVAFHFFAPREPTV